MYNLQSYKHNKKIGCKIKWENYGGAICFSNPLR